MEHLYKHCGPHQQEGLIILKLDNYWGSELRYYTHSQRYSGRSTELKAH